MKRLALFFDGTWNIPGSNTNVWRLSLMLAEAGRDGLAQKKFYDAGVGTRWYDRLTGGMFGAGLSENIRSGYRWLMEHYDPGDEIYLFGFSRGAFTARSLAGLISRCGLLKPDAPMSFMQVYERYQKGDTVRPLYELEYLQRHGHRDFDFEERTLLEYAYYGRDFIKMVGVWDTVGSIGIPFGNFKGISSRSLKFHNTNLSKVVQHSYQALAMDEYRHPYWAVLWTDFVPAVPKPGTPAEPDDPFVEQRWFAGAHANVGGGYCNDLLLQRPLAWMQKKAEVCGLGFRSHAIVTDEDLEMKPTDSYSQFLGGAWKLITLGKRYVRWVMAPPVRKKAHWKGTTRIEDGTVQTANERIDESVFLRCSLDPSYRPPGLVAWASRKCFDLQALAADPKTYATFCGPVIAPGIESRSSPPATSPAGEQNCAQAKNKIQQPAP